MTVYLNALGIVNALGHDKVSVLGNMLANSQKNVIQNHWVPETTTYVAQVDVELPAIPDELSEFKSRNNQLALHALAQLKPELEQAKAQYGVERIAVVIGTSTSGIAEGEEAIRYYQQTGNRPANYQYQQQEIGTVAEFVAEYSGVAGPAYTISTACSSSAHALGSAKRLIDEGLADAVIVGGVDSLCRLTVNGFAALESVSDEVTNPFSENRKGINIGEGAALFLLTKDAGEEAIELMSVGASSDAHHISAPEPEGTGAERAIQQALDNAGLAREDVTYINLHGTGTRLNDAMESKVIHRMFGGNVPCSSSKGQIGHTLGAAAANEVALCWLTLSSMNASGQLPPHLWDGKRDPELSMIMLNDTHCRAVLAAGGKQVHLSNSFAFGGNNAAVILGRRA